MCLHRTLGHSLVPSQSAAGFYKAELLKLACESVKYLNLCRAESAMSSECFWEMAVAAGCGGC